MPPGNRIDPYRLTPAWLKGGFHHRSAIGELAGRKGRVANDRALLAQAACKFVAVNAVDGVGGCVLAVQVFAVVKAQLIGVASTVLTESTRWLCPTSALV